MKQTLQLKLSQHLALTPQLQQSIRLLQLSTLELNQEIENFLQENPMLEREDEPAPEAAAGLVLGRCAAGAAGKHPRRAHRSRISATTARADWTGEGGNYGTPRATSATTTSPPMPEIQAAATSLRDHLGTQLAMMPLSERDRSLVRC
jgi:RNA polymerase sigma-54 factor